MIYIKDYNEDYFKGLIDLKEDSKDIFNSVYVSMLNDKAQFLLSRLEFNWYVTLAKVSCDDEEEYLESVEDMCIVHKCFEDYKKRLKVDSKHQLEEVEFISRISGILMEDAVECGNLDALWESFYQVERRLVFERLI